MEFWRFSNDLANETILLDGSHDPSLVVLSVVIASFAGITTLSLADRIMASPDTRSKIWWHTGGAIALACGIWAMHFTGMIAFSLPGHESMDYSGEVTLFSLLPAAVGSAAALYFIGRNLIRGWSLHLCALVLASGIGTMHYVGMEAMEMPGLRYDFGLFVLSIVVAYILALAALSVRGQLRASQTLPENAVNLLAGTVIGISIAGMHYTAMAAARFYHVETAHVHAASFSTSSLATTVTVFAGIILGLSSLATWIDRQVGFQRLMRLEQMAHTDALTGLPNRAMFYDQLENALEKSKRHGDRFAVLYFDLNKFKPVNDTYGHAAGDLLLREFSSRLKSILREEDLPARLGGDEFAALIRDFDSPTDLSKTATRLTESLSRPVKLSRLELPLSASIGISLYPDDASDIASLMQQADDAMYRAKTQGLAFSFASKALNSQTYIDADGIDGLQAAIAREKITLLYQPFVSATNRDIRGLEVIACLPGQPAVGQNASNTLIEGHCLNSELVNLVIQSTCKQIQEWKSAGVAFKRLAVNINGAQLTNGDFAKNLHIAMREYDVKSTDIELEIEASSLRLEHPSTRRQLSDIAECGIDLTIDDVDGSVPLALFSQVPACKIKLSRDMVSKACQSEKAMAQTRAICEFAKAVGLDVGCAGIESEAHASVLETVGITTAQGSFYQQALSADIVATKLQSEITPSKAANS